MIVGWMVGILAILPLFSSILVILGRLKGDNERPVSNVSCLLERFPPPGWVGTGTRK